KFGGTLKRAGCLFMIEGVDQAQSLVKKFLRFSVAGGNRVMQVPKASHERGLGRRRIVRAVLRGWLLRKHQAAKPKQDRKGCHSVHRRFLLIKLRSFDCQRFYTYRMSPELIRIHAKAWREMERCARVYCFLPNTSRNSAVVWAAGSLRIFFSSSPIT